MLQRNDANDLLAFCFASLRLCVFALILSWAMPLTPKLEAADRTIADASADGRTQYGRDARVTKGSPVLKPADGTPARDTGVPPVPCAQSDERFARRHACKETTQISVESLEADEVE